MSASDLTFSLVSSGETIYDPQLIGPTPISIRVTNYGDTDLTDLGLYIAVSYTHLRAHET